MPSRSQSSFFYLDTAWRTMKSHAFAFLASLALALLIFFVFDNFDFLFTTLFPAPSPHFGRIAKLLTGFFLLTTFFLPILFLRSLHTQKRLRPRHDTALFFKHYHRLAALTLISVLIVVLIKIVPLSIIYLYYTYRVESIAGLLMMIFPGLICSFLIFLLFLHFSLAFLLVFDPPRKNIFHLMGKSWTLMRGNRLTLFCIVFIVTIFSRIANTLFTRIPVNDAFLPLKTIPFTVFNILLIAWFILAWIAFYEDLKETVP